MTRTDATRDHVDVLQAEWEAQGADLDRDALGVVLRIQALARRFDERLSRRLETCGLAWWQYDVLSALRRQGPPYALGASALAEAGALTSGALTTRVDRLVADGLVERRRDVTDRRRVQVRLTQRGLALVDAAARIRFEAAEEALAGLSAGERRRLNELLRGLLAAG